MMIYFAFIYCSYSGKFLLDVSREDSEFFNKFNYMDLCGYFSSLRRILSEEFGESKNSEESKNFRKFNLVSRGEFFNITVVYESF